MTFQPGRARRDANGRKDCDDERDRDSTLHLCPTSLWQLVQINPPLPALACAGSIDAVTSVWHFRLAIARLPRRGGGVSR